MFGFGIFVQILGYSKTLKWDYLKQLYEIKISTRYIKPLSLLVICFFKEEVDYISTQLHSFHICKLCFALLVLGEIVVFTAITTVLYSTKLVANEEWSVQSVLFHQKREIENMGYFLFQSAKETKSMQSF